MSEVHTFSALKRHEDALDALVCAWVGTEFLAGAAVPLGDDTRGRMVPAGRGLRMNLNSLLLR